MPSPILARADALMQRRRQQTDADNVPVLTDAIETDDDIPVLIDIDPGMVIAKSSGSGVANTAIETIPPQPTPPIFDAALRDILAHELARRVEQRITAELPRIIESTVRDFLAEQEMISTLPPQD